MNDPSKQRKEHHDVLVVTREGEYHRFPVERRGEQEGRFVQPPVRPDLEAPGTRKVLNLARAGEPERPRGPAFAVLPIKPEPAGSAVCTCYLINVENLSPSNPWVADAWSDNAIAQQPRSSADASLDVLLAGPGGVVYHVHTPAAGGAPTVRAVDLTDEVEIWSQLRNGCIAGAAEYAHHPDEPGRIIPLVNVTGLAPNPES